MKLDKSKGISIFVAPAQIKLSQLLGRLNKKDYIKFEITRN